MITPSKAGSPGLYHQAASVETVPWGEQDRHGPGFFQDVVHDDLWRSVELLARTPLASTTVRDCVVPQDPWFRGVRDRVVFLHIDVVSSSDILPLSGSISWPGSVTLLGIHPPNVTADRGTRTETCWTFARVPPRPSSAHRHGNKDLGLASVRPISSKPAED